MNIKDKVKYSEKFLIAIGCQTGKFPQLVGVIAGVINSGQGEYASVVFPGEFPKLIRMDCLEVVQ